MGKTGKISFNPSSLLLLLAAFIWGTAFVSQSVGMDYIQPLTFSCLRNFIGVAVLIPAALIRRSRARKSPNYHPMTRADWKLTLRAGFASGAVLAVASTLQQYGIAMTTVGKAGFLTALYIVLVPVLGVFIGRKPGRLVVLSVAIAVAGLYFLCMTAGSFHMEAADLILIACAFSFAVQILVIDRYADRVDSVLLALFEFLFCGLLLLVPMFAAEHPTMTQVASAWLPLLYAGGLSSGVAYTLQIAGQKGTDPTIASLLMSLESVFSALSGFFILQQVLSGRELIGCALMFAAIIITQMPQKKAAAPLEAADPESPSQPSSDSSAF